MTILIARHPQRDGSASPRQRPGRNFGLGDWVPVCASRNRGRPPPAHEIARQVGPGGLRSTADLRQAAAGERRSDLLADGDGFVEVYPEDKYAVVRQLQAAGHVAGMTGDGVNGAPALRQAESRHRRQRRHRRGEGRRQRGADRARSGEHGAAGRAAALAADPLLGTAATFTGLAGLAPLPASQILALLAYALVAGLALNDAIKVALIRRLVPAAAQ